MTRSRAGLDALREAMAESAPALCLLPIDGIPCAFLTAEEFATACRVHVNRVYALIRSGDVQVVDEFGCRGPRIPVSELCRWQAKAHPQTA